MSNRTELGRLVEAMSEAEVQTVLTFVQFLEQGHVRPAAAAKPRAAVEQPDMLTGAVEVPQTEWGVILDGFSHLFHDLDCHLWVQTDGGDTYTLARNVPLGQIYFDAKGSERNAVQVALNRSGTVYSDFRFMHRIAEPEGIYLRETDDDELMDVVVKSAGKLTLLEMSIPESAQPGVRKLAFHALKNGRPPMGDRRG
jgi:hypothetical protein